MITELKFLDQKTLPSVSSKKREQSEIASQVAEFLKNGGEIETLKSPGYVGQSTRAVGFGGDLIGAF